MNAAHTPGPWEFVDNSLVGPKLDGSPIWPRYVILRSEVGVKTVDARLIAAAPELLAALIALDNYVSNNLSRYYPTGIDLSSLEFRNASKAIAKATGCAA